MSNQSLTIEKHLDAIEFLDDKLVLAVSNLNGRYWDGSLFCFKEIEDAPDVSKSLAAITMDSGISSICCLKNNRIFAGLDSGCIEVYELIEPDWPCLQAIFQSLEHDDVVSSVSANIDHTKVISSGYDKCIKVWDIESYTSIATYRPVHSGIIWQAACSPSEPDLVLTCGQDGKLFLLDLRLPKPALSLGLGLIRGIPVAVAWQPQNKTTFAVGDDCGSIAMRDIRNPETLSHCTHHVRRIHKLGFSNANPNWLASCADSTELVVIDISKENPSIEFRDNSHDDFIRGLVWGKDNCLVTCGWDKKLIKHTVNSSDMDVANGPVFS